MRIFTFTFLLVAALIAAPRAARAAEAATVRAILITATKEKAAADPRLAPYEATLQRNLPESSFRFVGEGSATINRGRASIPLDRGHRLEIEGGDRSPNGAIKLSMQWMSGKNLIIEDSRALRPGTPVVLGQRPSGDGDVHMVIVIAK